MDFDMLLILPQMEKNIKQTPPNFQNQRIPKKHVYFF